MNEIRIEAEVIAEIGVQQAKNRDEEPYQFSSSAYDVFPRIRVMEIKSIK